MLWMYIFIWLTLLSLSNLITSQAIHTLYYSIKEKRIMFPWKKILSIISTSVIFIFILAIYTIILVPLQKYAILRIIVLCIFILMILAGLIIPFIPYILDYIWLNKHHCAKKMTREQFCNNIEKLRTKKYKNKYFDILIQNKVILTGEWPDKCQPKLKNDELIYKLSKLDCANIANLYDRT